MIQQTTVYFVGFDNSCYINHTFNENYLCEFGFFNLFSPLTTLVSTTLFTAGNKKHMIVINSELLVFETFNQSTD